MVGMRKGQDRHRALALLLGVGLLAGCGDYPRDAEDSALRARTSAMRIGVSHDPPHVVFVDGADPRGDDIERIRALARTQGARIEWVALGHDRLMQDLMAFRLHAVAGGHVADSPWQPRVGWSRPWHARAGGDGPLRERRFALPPGENAWQIEVDRFLHDYDRAAGVRAP